MFPEETTYLLNGFLHFLIEFVGRLEVITNEIVKICGRNWTVEIHCVC